MPQQPQPEFLVGPPPSGLKPFGLVTQQPSPATPAGAAGLTAGDALLSFGEARHLRDLQKVLSSNIGTPVVVLCVDAAGRYVRKYVVPAQWDSKAPKSLLGCQMSNQCPADHPAVSGLLLPPRNVAVSSGRARSVHAARRSANGHRHQPSRQEMPPLQAARSTCCARVCLALISTLQLVLMFAILGLPTVSPGAADLLRLARLHCSADAPSVPHAGSPLDLDLDLEVRRMLARTEDDRPLLTAHHLPPPPPKAMGGAAAPTPSTNPMLSQRLSSPGFDVLTVSGSGQGGQLLTNLQLHGQLDVDDMVFGILVACLFLSVLATLGMTVACSHARSCAHRLSSTLYFVGGTPVWAALSFAVIYCFVFRDEAEALVRRYWACLLLADPDHKSGAARSAWGAAAAVYQSITLTATLLLACDVLVLAGLFSAGNVIGWASLASNLLNVINGGLLLAGGGLVAVAVGLHGRAEGGVHADTAMVALGAGVLAVSTIGLLGSRLHSACLLRLYTVCSTLITLALGVFVACLSVLGVQGLADSDFVASNWHYISDIYPIPKHEFLQLLGRHWTKLMIASALLLFVQLLVVIASCVLRRHIVPSALEAASRSEQAGLIQDDDEDDDDDGGVV